METNGSKKASFVSLQFIVAMTVLFGMNSPAFAKKAKKPTFKPSYKVEQCDCLGYSEDIPTFLSDLSGGGGISIFGEGKTPEAAQGKARNMCVEAYREFASAKKGESGSVTESGCQMFKSTENGDWISI